MFILASGTKRKAAREEAFRVQHTCIVTIFVVVSGGCFSFLSARAIGAVPLMRGQAPPLPVSPARACDCRAAARQAASKLARPVLDAACVLSCRHRGVRLACGFLGRLYRRIAPAACCSGLPACRARPPLCAWLRVPMRVPQHAFRFPIRSAFARSIRFHSCVFHSCVSTGATRQGVN